MNRFSFWRTWLLVFSIIVVIFGVALVLWGGTPLFAWMNAQIDPVFWTAQTLSPETAAFRQWVYAVLGATMTGWGTSLIFIVRYPFARRERWAWNCVAMGLSLWFVLDTYASLYFKVYFNAVFNAAFVMAALPPLIFTRRHFA